MVLFAYPGLFPEPCVVDLNRMLRIWTWMPSSQIQMSRTLIWMGRTLITMLRTWMGVERTGSGPGRLTLDVDNQIRMANPRFGHQEPDPDVKNWIQTS
jgi:hypothetical protein